MSKQTIKDIRNRNPFPWSCVTNSNGLIRVMDANESEVPLVDLVSFGVAITSAMAKLAPAEAPP